MIIKTDQSISTLAFLLRLGVFGTFLGHGINALLVKPGWIHLITCYGFSEHFAMRVMPLIGVLDVLVAFSVLFKPLPYVVLWAAFWAFLTAITRPISGESFLEFVERTANWTVPLVLYFLIRKSRSIMQPDSQPSQGES